MALVNNGRASAVNGLATACTFLSAHSAWPGTTGTNELTGGSPAYARVAATWGAASGGVRTLTSTNVINVPASTNVQFYGAWDAATTGNLQAIFGLNGQDQEMQVDTAGDLILCEGHGLVANNQVVFMVTGLAGGVPTGLTEGTLYFVISTGLTVDAFKVSATQGGSAIDLTGKGAPGCVFSKVIPEVYAAQGTTTPTGLTIGVGS